MFNVMCFLHYSRKSLNVLVRNPSPDKMVREDKATRKANYFLKIIVSLGSDSNFSIILE